VNQKRLICSVALAISLTGLPALASETKQLASVADLLVGLEKRLEVNPNDVDGWVLLGRSYHHLQNWNKAKAAFDKAKQLGYAGEAPNIDAAAKPTTSKRNVDKIHWLKPSDTIDLLIAPMAAACATPTSANCDQR
jgi:predicted Zn-dependent protease